MKNVVIPRIAVCLAGFCAFLNLYAPQALLPSLAHEFGVGAAAISTIMTASTLAIALTAPFTGAVADVLGRKRVITAAMIAIVVPTTFVGLAADVHQLVVWRFIQGLLLPPIFAVTVAYIGDEWPPSQVTSIAGIYTAGSSLGGFSGRFLSGLLADLFGWRAAFLVLAALTLAGAVGIALMLPRERKFVPSIGIMSSIVQMVRHLQNPQLVATYAVGFGVLFNFIATFTYLSFHLAAPPYNFSPTLLGAVFVTYLVGVAAAPTAGRAVGRFGRRKFTLWVIAIWVCGIALTLASSIALIMLGLALCAGCGILCQTVSTGYVTTTAKAGRSSAVGLYVTSFYFGGSVGAFVPGLAYEHGGWPACVELVVGILTIMALIVMLTWTTPRRA
ncbi:MAG: MFS transporter [Bradyrhizobiaceae bacterium]|nr:MFS transporter [Bradyrhizobiaceae bacterium]